MKLIARILLILAAAGAVAGVTMALVGSQAARAGEPGRGAPGQVQVGGANALPGSTGGEQRRNGGPGGFERGGRAPSLFGAGDMLKDLAVIGLIVLITAPLTRLLGRLRAAPEKRANPEPPVIAP
jgi:hypothetical protein